MTMMILGLYNDLSSGWVFVFFDILVFITAQEWRQLLRINLQSPYISTSYLSHLQSKHPYMVKISISSQRISSYYSANIPPGDLR